MQAYLSTDTLTDCYQPSSFTRVLIGAHIGCIMPCLAPCGLRGCKNGPAPFLGRMSYKATKPGLVFVLYLSMFFIVLVFIRAPFYVLLVFIKQRRLRGLLCRWPSITEWEMYITAQGCRLRNDLYCVEWDVKLYYTIPRTVPLHLTWGHTHYRVMLGQKTDQTVQCRVLFS